MDIQTAKKEAIKQSRKIKHYSFRLGAVIFNRHRIIGAGYNRKFSKGHYDLQGNCAEVMALRKSPSKLLKGSTILVCRVNKSGSLGMSKPCARCMKKILKAGIVKIIYSIPNGWDEINLRG